MRNFLSILIVIVSAASWSQTSLLVKPSANGDHLRIKWYSENLVSDKPVHLLKSEDGNEWTEIKQQVLFGLNQPLPEDYKADPELEQYVKMCVRPTDIKDLVRLSAVLKSFSSAPFCRYLGIMYEDYNVESGKKYQYKIQIEGSAPVLSALVTSAEPEKMKAPGSIKIKQHGSAAAISWAPEPQRFYAVNIYRRCGDSVQYHKINASVVLLSSGSKDKWNFSDEDLTTETDYYYQVEALDFFGEPSQRSADIKFRLKDVSPPSAPGKPKVIVQGRIVRCSWENTNTEIDFTGYNLYRTNKNDTDFTRLNKSLILKDTKEFRDSVDEFQTYSYKLATTDRSGNEAFSNPVFAEVFDNEPPSVPVDLKIISDSGTIRLSWKINKEKDLLGYYIYRSIDDNKADNFVKLNAVAIRSDKYEDKLPNKARNRFVYKIVAVDKELNRSGYSACISSRIKDIDAPKKPFLFGDESANENIQWFKNSETDLLKYELFRKDSFENKTASRFAKIATLGPAEKAYKDNLNKKPGIYLYYLVATDSSGLQSLPSNKISVTVRKALEDAPSVEAKANYKAETKFVHLRWTIRKSDDRELLGTVLYRKLDSENNFQPITALTKTSDYADTEVSEHAEYEYQVRCYFSDGTIVRSEIKNVTTQKKHKK